MKGIRAFAWLFGAGLLAVAPHAAAKPVLTTEQYSTIERYDVLSFADPQPGGIDRQKAIGLFDATPDEVERVITDYARWSEFMPKVRQSDVYQCAGRACSVHLVAELRWPVGRSWLNAQFELEPRGDSFVITFQRVAGPAGGTMRRYEGRIFIEPYRTADGVLRLTVTYELLAEPDLLAPKHAINSFTKRSTAGFVHALRQRINELHQAGLLHPTRPPLPVAAPAQEPTRARATR